MEIFSTLEKVLLKTFSSLPLGILVLDESQMCVVSNSFMDELVRESCMGQKFTVYPTHIAKENGTIVFCNKISSTPFIIGGKQYLSFLFTKPHKSQQEGHHIGGNAAWL